MRARGPLVALVFLTACATPPRPAAPPAPVHPWIARARALHLADASQWHALLHYRPRRLGGGVESLADDPDFFRAARGKTDPAAELEATLRDLLDPAARTRDGQHPRCAYPARLAWLAERVGFDPAELPAADCARYATWKAGIDAHAVTLVLAEAFMNNPSSMFGHTLLRIDQAPPEAGDARRDLLAYAVNFAAETGSDGGMLFAVKGLTGAYPGHFTVLPYYQKVKQYSDWESRDLWEYALDLTPGEVERMVAHLWELQGVRFDYWFFDENCSYELLGLIEAVRPDLDLRGRFGLWAIPVDTAREVLAEAGLAGEIRWRPSSTTRLAARVRELAPAERHLVAALSEGRVAPDDARVAALPERTRAVVLTAAHDRLRLRAEDDPAERERSLALLRARSRVPVRGEGVAPPPPPAVRPDQGHETAALRLGAGVRDGRLFLEARARPAFHDLLDPPGGYLDGAQIRLLDTALRFYPDESEPDLHELMLVDIVSLAPRDALFDPVSWHARTGLTTRLLRAPHGDGVSSGKLFVAEGGAGLTRRLGRGWWAHAFLDGALEASGKLRPGWALGAGARVGLTAGAAGDRWRLLAEAEALRFVAGDTRTRLGLRVAPALRLTRRSGLELDLALRRDFRTWWLEGGLYWKRWF